MTLVGGGSVGVVVFEIDPPRRSGEPTGSWHDLVLTAAPDLVAGDRVKLGLEPIGERERSSRIGVCAVLLGAGVETADIVLAAGCVDHPVRRDRDELERVRVPAPD